MKAASSQATESSPPMKKRGRKPANDSKPPATKRLKKEHRPSDEDVQNSDANESPRSKKVGKLKLQKATRQPREKKVDTPSESEHDSVSVEEPPSSDEYASEASGPKKKGKGRKRKVEPDDDDDLDKSGSHADSEAKAKPKKTGKNGISVSKSKEAVMKSKAKAEESDDEGEDKSQGHADTAVEKPKLKEKNGTPVTKTKKTPAKRKAKTEDSDDEDKKSSKPASKSATSKPPPPNEAERSSPVFQKPAKETEAEIKAADSDSSEMSIVLDEPPPKSRKNKKSTTTSTKTPKAPPAPVSALGQEIKTLQTQLLSCGIRKIWAFELKQYGEDEKAKLKHLKRMLEDAGMKGRYSKARAKEIKVERELRDDLEAVREGERHWGIEGEEGRPKRGMGGKLKQGREETGSAGEEDAHKKEDPQDKRRRVMNELAFLGDESESD